MAKANSPKNTKNKALHSKLMGRKKRKKAAEKDKNKERLKEIARQFHASQTEENLTTDNKI